MVNQVTSHMYGFEINPFRMDSRAKEPQTLATPALLRELWTRHLINEQDQLSKAESLRRPLQASLATRNFFDN